jgi:hypothetical protein
MDGGCSAAGMRIGATAGGGSVADLRTAARTDTRSGTGTHGHRRRRA